MLVDIIFSETRITFPLSRQPVIKSRNKKANQDQDRFGQDRIFLGDLADIVQETEFNQFPRIELRMELTSFEHLLGHHDRVFLFKTGQPVKERKFLGVKIGFCKSRVARSINRKHAGIKLLAAIKDSTEHRSLCAVQSQTA